MSNKTIILALHDNGDIRSLFEYICSNFGCNIYIVPQAEYAILSEKIKEIKPFGIIMDLNLSNPNSLEYGPAKRAYEVAKPFVGDRFLGISGNRKTVENALNDGIPSDYKPLENFPDFVKRFFDK